MILQRIRQFYRAINASLVKTDYDFINKYLNKAEQNLFFAMNIFDQRHVLNVAYTAKKIVQDEQLKNIDMNLLMKVCLLHDIGRQSCDICLIDKVLGVLLTKTFPNVTKSWANEAQKNKNNKKNFWQKRKYALYIYYNHAQIGAILLEKIGLIEIANVIKQHHQQPKISDKIELKILKQADNIN